jgi:hypothetical protein
MNEVLAQIILASRKGNNENWMKVLFPVFLAIFWAISAIAKKKAKKSEEEKTGVKQLSIKPGGKPASGTTKEGPFQKIRRAIEAEVQKQRELQTQQQAQRKVVRPQPAARKVVPKTESAARISASKPAVEARSAQLTPQVGPEIQELPEFTVKAFKKLKDKHISTPSEIPQAKHLAEILSDYSDPDELKRAILHYEILGRPIALRGSSGSVIGL